MTPPCIRAGQVGTRWAYESDENPGDLAMRVVSQTVSPCGSPYGTAEK
jgi:hypothetical protein